MAQVTKVIAMWQVLTAFSTIKKKSVAVAIVLFS